MWQILHWGLETTKYDRAFVGSEFLRFTLVLVWNGAPDTPNHQTINRPSFGSPPYALQECEGKLAVLGFGEEVKIEPDNFVIYVSVDWKSQ
jgi:hypothetical protein